MNRDDLLGMLDLSGDDPRGEESARPAIGSAGPVEAHDASPTALVLDDWGRRRGRELLTQSGRLRRLGIDESAAGDFLDCAFNPEPELASACVDRLRHGFVSELLRTPDYTAIVNERHFDRLAGYLDEAAATGARIVNLAPAQDKPDRASRRFPPHLVLDAAGDCRVMREEIFGPILPVIGYGALDEAIRYVNERPRPLALYCFDHDDARVERLLDETIAGGVTINDTILHIAQDDLPFGGVGPRRTF